MTKKFRKNIKLVKIYLIVITYFYVSCRTDHDIFKQYYLLRKCKAFSRALYLPNTLNEQEI